MRKIAWLYFGILFVWGCGHDAQKNIVVPVISPARWAHTATKLTDGRILIVGGFIGDSVGDGEAVTPDSALIINPDTGDVQSIGPLSQKRYWHTATRLRDGRVLIAGGQSSDPFSIALAEAEIFDPQGNRFEPTATPMAIARHTHTATLLNDGLVLLAGGDGPYMDSVNNTCELFDPATGGFLSIQDTIHNRTGHVAILLNSGLVLIAGGTNWSGTELYPKEVDLFDPATSAILMIDDPYPLPSSYLDGAQKLPSGKVLLLNMDINSDTNMAALYNPATEMFEETGGLKQNRQGATCTLLDATGDVVVIGGYVPGSAFSPVLEVEKYDPHTGVFVECGRILQPRFRHTATVLSNNQILLVGGFGPDKKPIEKCELIQIN